MNETFDRFEIAQKCKSEFEARSHHNSDIDDDASGSNYDSDDDNHFEDNKTPTSGYTASKIVTKSIARKSSNNKTKKSSAKFGNNTCYLNKTTWKI